MLILSAANCCTWQCFNDNLMVDCCVVPQEVMCARCCRRITKPWKMRLLLVAAPLAAKAPTRLSVSNYEMNATAVAWQPQPQPLEEIFSSSQQDYSRILYSIYLRKYVYKCFCIKVFLYNTFVCRCQSVCMLSSQVAYGHPTNVAFLNHNATSWMLARSRINKYNGINVTTESFTLHAFTVFT